MKKIHIHPIILLVLLSATTLAQNLILQSNTGHSTKGITAARFSPNEKYIASLSSDGIKLWDFESGK